MGAYRPSLDDPRCEALLLRLHACIDIHEFWSAPLSIFDALLPHDACVAYLDYVDLRNNVGRIADFRDAKCAPAARLGIPSSLHGGRRLVLLGVRGRSRLLALMMPRLSND